MRRKFWLTAIFITLVAVLCIANYGVWTDEVFTLRMVQNSYSEILAREITFDSTTLYYVTLKTILNIFGAQTYQNTIFIARLFSVVPIALLLVMGIHQLEQWYSPKLILPYALTMLCGNMLQYAFEIRSYSWSILFVTLSFIALLGIVKTNDTKYYRYLTLWSILAFWVHKPSVVPLFLIYLYLFCMLLKTKYYHQFRYFVWTFLGCLPVVIYTFVMNIDKPYNYYAKGAILDIVSLNKLKETLVFPFDTGILPISLIILGGISLLFVWYAFHNYQNNTLEIYGILVLPITAIIMIGISLMTDHDYYPKYMLPALGIFLLCCAIMATKYIKSIPILIVFAIVSYQTTFQEEYASKEGFKKVAYYFNHVFEGENLVANFDYGAYILDYYQFDKVKSVVFHETFDGTKGYYFIRNGFEEQYLKGSSYQIVDKFNISNDIFVLCKVE